MTFFTVPAKSTERPDDFIETKINSDLIAAIRPWTTTGRGEHGEVVVNINEELSVVTMSGDRSGSGWLVKMSVQALENRLGIFPSLEYTRRA